MARVSVSAHIEAPVEEVFALAADLENAPGRFQGITKIELLTPGLVGVGTRFRETRVMFGRPATEVMEFTAFEPNRGYTLTALSCGARYVSTFHFEPDGAGTLVSVYFEVRAITFFAKLMKPLGWLMADMLRKCLLKDLDDLRRAAESAPRPA